jgi:hypothetical protein
LNGVRRRSCAGCDIFATPAKIRGQRSHDRLGSLRRLLYLCERNAVADNPVDGVSCVVAVSRKPLAVQHPNLEAVIGPDMFHLQHVDTLQDSDACFFCLGASSVGMSAEDYRRLTYDLTAAVARQLLPGNPRTVFEYISGEGTDAKSRQRWAQVKAETETALLNMGFRDAYALRPVSSSRCGAS